jgi:hypothetical protein
MLEDNQKSDLMSYLDSKNEITRSELFRFARASKISFNSYIAQIMRIYPDIKVINDLSYKESIF